LSEEFYTEPIVGFRAWGISGVPIRLTGVVYTSGIWKPKEPTQAICMKMRGSKFAHPYLQQASLVEPCDIAPNIVCNDGFFGFYTIDLLNKSGMPFTHSLKAVRGTFQAWGKIILHEHGFRAEYVEPIAIVHETRETIIKWMPMAFLSSEKKEEAFNQRNERLNYLSRHYNIPVIPIEEIEGYSSQYGTLPQL